jgi:hypothetical protein
VTKWRPTEAGVLLCIVLEFFVTGLLIINENKYHLQKEPEEAHSVGPTALRCWALMGGEGGLSGRIPDPTKKRCLLS